MRDIDRRTLFCLAHAVSVYLLVGGAGAAQPDELVDVGGHALFVTCAGTDAGPTMVLAGGAGGTTAGWATVQKKTAGFSRVCSDDRASLDGAKVMTLKVTVVCIGGAPLPPGSSVKVEVRDTSLADAPAIALHRVTVNVPKTGRTITVKVPVELATVPDGTTIWAHVDADRDGRVSVGDYVSVESYPVKPAPVQTMTIRVKKVT